MLCPKKTHSNTMAFVSKCSFVAVMCVLAAVCAHAGILPTCNYAYDTCGVQDLSTCSQSVCGFNTFAGDGTLNQFQSITPQTTLNTFIIMLQYLETTDMSASGKTSLRKILRLVSTLLCSPKV